MKVTALCLVFFGIVAVSYALKECSKQTDCAEDECCLDNMFMKPYCEKRYSAGNKCHAISKYLPEKDLFLIACPCVPMYECLGKGVLGEDGETYMKDTKCIMPTV